MEKLKTADGTITLFNQDYKEAYHSTKAGAYTESLHKFIKPTLSENLLLSKKQINILDIGFGLGYNVAVALEYIEKVNPSLKVNIVSIEKDKSVLNKIKQIEFPENLQSIYEKILNGKFSKTNGFETYQVNADNFTLTIFFDEARKVLKHLKEKNYRFNAVFWDAFSPKVNTEMWTVNIFKLVKEIMEEDAVLATYSASLAVRKGLLEAGFKIGLVEPVGRRSYSTVATLNGKIPPLTEKEKKRLETSPYAFPYEDNEDLTLPAEEIKQNWEKKLQERLKN